jgi:uncharacterized membrane protein SirB2
MEHKERTMEQKERSGLSVFDGVLIVGGGIIALVVAFAVLSAVVGAIWFVVKVVLVVALVGLVARFLFRRRS